MVKSKQPFRFKIRGYLSKTPPEASQKSPPPPGFVFKFLQSPATRSYHIYRSSGVIFFDNLVDSFSTDARRGLSTLLFSPLAISQLTAGVFFTGSISVVSMWFWSKDLFVIQTSLKVRFVIWLLNI
jgi:hypothetical protein